MDNTENSIPDPSLDTITNIINYCPVCGKKPSTSSQFCYSCGTPLVIGDNTPKQENIYINTGISPQRPVVLHNSEKSMKWFNFFVKYAIPFWLIVGSIVYYSQTAESVGQYYNGSFSEFFSDKTVGIINVLDLLTQILCFILLICSIGPLKYYKRTGYLIIIWYFIIRMGYPLIASLFYIDYIGISSIISQNLFNVVICVLNLLYFVKRKQVFIN